MAPCVLFRLQDEQAGFFRRTWREMKIRGGADNGQKSCRRAVGRCRTEQKKPANLLMSTKETILFSFVKPFGFIWKKTKQMSWFNTFC